MVFDTRRRSQGRHSRHGHIAGRLRHAKRARRGFGGHGFSGVADEFQHHEITLQGGFALAVREGNAEASYNAPAPWPVLKGSLPIAQAEAGGPAQFTWQGMDYTLGSAPVQGG